MPLPRRSVSETELTEVVRRVAERETEDRIPQWTQADAPASVLSPAELPQPGTITRRRELPALGATELVLGNGMRARRPCHSKCLAVRSLTPRHAFNTEKGRHASLHLCAVHVQVPFLRQFCGHRNMQAKRARVHMPVSSAATTHCASAQHTFFM